MRVMEIVSNGPYRVGVITTLTEGTMAAILVLQQGTSLRRAHGGLVECSVFERFVGRIGSFLSGTDQVVRFPYCRA